MCARRNAVRGAAALLTLAAASAHAGPDAGSTTLFVSRPYERDGAAHSEGAFYEQFSLLTPAASYGPVDDVRVVVRAWGRALAGEPMVGDTFTGDVDTAYVEARFLDRRALLRVGRQMLNQGASGNIQIDGGSGEVVIWKGLGLQAYGGAPVVARFDYHRGDAIAGGRVFWRQSFDAEIGVSYVYALDSGITARNDIAVDGWWQAFRTVSLGAFGQWSLAESGRLAEARVLASWQPLKALQLTASAQRTAPDLFIPRSSIFAVFSDERRDEAGGEIAVRFGQRVSAWVDAAFVSVEAGDGWRAGSKVSYRPLRETTTLGAEVRILKEPANGFDQVRLFALHRLPQKITVTLEVDGYRLDQPVNGRLGSLICGFTAGYPITDRFDVMASGSFGTTPFLDRRFEAIARLSYRFGNYGGRP
jgi:hypothetical protein